MNYKNGYKVVYEVAAEGKRTFYATTSNEYPTRDAEGNITDTVIASFDDADFVGKTIYEYEGKFYKSAGRLPAYDENGAPADGEELLDFSEVLEEKTASYGRRVNEDAGEDRGEDEEPTEPEATEPEVTEPETEPEVEETDTPVEPGESEDPDNEVIE